MRFRDSSDLSSFGYAGSIPVGYAKTAATFSLNGQDDAVRHSRCRSILHKAEKQIADAADAVAYEPGKKVKGCKIHSLVDTLGLPIRLVVHCAGVRDRDGAAFLFDKIKLRFPWLECVFSDTSYNAQQTCEAAAGNGLRLEVVRCNPNAVGFKIIKRC